MVISATNVANVLFWKHVEAQISKGEIRKLQNKKKTFSSLVFEKSQGC